MVGASEPTPPRYARLADHRQRLERRRLTFRQSSRAAAWSLLVAGTLLVAMLVASCGPLPGAGQPAAGAEAPPPTALPPAREPSDPGQPGPYGVGYQTLLVPNRQRPDRVLTTSVWYPSPPSPRRAAPGGGRPGSTSGGPLAPARTAPAAQTIPAVIGTPARYPVAPGVEVPAARAEEEATVAPGRFPLVVISHGSAGSRVQLAYLAEALASHGFVVAAPDHPGDTMIEAAEGRQAPLVDLASDRILDVSRVISAFTDDDCPLSAMVRADEVAVVGFSFGGLTSVVSSVGFLRAPADPRVRAVVGIAGATEVVPTEQLARVTVPVLLIGGRMDGAVPFERNTLRAFDELTGARPRYLVAVAGGTHNSFTEICAQAAAAREAEVARAAEVADGVRLRLEVTEEMTCRPPAIAIDRAHSLTAHYTVAFLERHLVGVTGYGRYLTPATAEPHPEAELRAVN
ncbi:dienelactone hydrolase family protein [Frankia sp. EI5c]|uniref:alpha/beta hydrolase family protein n=1 Tax=Frankia sp. EI5c TaxID=683316 RepID=UPI000A03A5EA|nr:dienelactone hydrolase family protein [Frankia sp. EI5c]